MAGDVLQKGTVKISEFNQALLAQHVHLTKEEIRRLVKLSRSDSRAPAMDLMSNSAVDENMAGTLNYVQLSKNLGLHKSSLDLIQGSNKNIRNVETARKLMQ